MDPLIHGSTNRQPRLVHLVFGRECHPRIAIVRERWERLEIQLACRPCIFAEASRSCLVQTRNWPPFCISSPSNFAALQQITMALAKCSVYSDFETRGLRQRTVWNADVWTSIMSLLKANDLLSLALTNREFYNLVMKDYVWKALCLRDFNINDFPVNPAFSWKSLYKAAFDGTHSYSLETPGRHIDYARVGSFLVTSGELFATGVGLLCEESQLLCFGLCENLQTLSLPAKKGPWIADLHLIHCPSCDVSVCGGNVQVFDIRHWELFLEGDYLSGLWKYEQVCSFTIRGNCPWAVACVADKTQVAFADENPDCLPDFTTIRGEPEAWLPRWKSFQQAAATCTILQSNEGLQVTYYVMKAGQEGPIVGLRGGLDPRLRGLELEHFSVLVIPAHALCPKYFRSLMTDKHCGTTLPNTNALISSGLG